MMDLSNTFLSPYVQQKLVEEDAKIKEEIRSKGPNFDFSSIKDRRKRVKAAAEAEQAAMAEELNKDR